jgi:hypothetical protein
MLKKTLIAAAAAGALGLGVLGTAAPAAAAGGPGVNAEFGGPGWSVTIGNGQYNPYNQYRPGKFCQPITKKVKWWDRFGYPHWSVVVVGQKCPPPKFPPYGPFPGGPGNHGPFPGGPGPFPGGPGPHGPHWGW